MTDIFHDTSYLIHLSGQNSEALVLKRETYLSPFAYFSEFVPVVLIIARVGK